MWTVLSLLGQLAKILSNRKDVRLSDYSPCQTPYRARSQAFSFNKWFLGEKKVTDFRVRGNCKIPGSVRWEMLVADKGRKIREKVGIATRVSKIDRWVGRISWAWMEWIWGTLTASSVVKALLSNARCMGLIPGVGELGSHIPHNQTIKT